MRRLEFSSLDAHIARVCDPTTAKRYIVVYHNPNTREHYLAARVLPGELDRFKEALTGQGCKIVIYQQEGSEWPALRWLGLYDKTAPLDLVRDRILAIGGKLY